MGRDIADWVDRAEKRIFVGQVSRINHCCHLKEAGIADGDGGASAIKFGSNFSGGQEAAPGEEGMQPFLFTAVCTPHFS